MDTQPTDDPEESPSQPTASSSTPSKESGPPPPSSSTNPPPLEENPPNDSDPDDQSPPATSQEPPEDTPPSAASQESPENSPAPPINTQPINSPPPPSDDFSLSGSRPSPLSSGPPPGGQLTSNPRTLTLPSPSLTSLVLPGPPTSNGSNNVLEKSKSNGGEIRTIGLVAIGLVFGMVLLGVIGFTVRWLLRLKVAKAGLPTSLGASAQSDYAWWKMLSSSANALVESGHESANGSSGLGNSRNWFSYEELVRVTNEFSESNLLGEGGFGSVFKGRLKDGREVAVKKLKDGGGQGEREFRAEVETISRIHHRHLVSLVGYCISDDKRLLVYDYVPKDTLHFHLHGKGEPVLDWPTRIKIATGAARGIAYLHKDCHPRIVHRDIKSSNILLDNNFEAQVSDFGLARWFSDLNTHVTTRVMGTFGYMSPEYALSGKLTEKSDVFSFGVVLLELITGRKPVDSSQPPGEESLVEWARPLLNEALDKEEFEKLVDPRLENNYVDSEMFRAIEVAAACVQYSALKRPKMSQVLRAFDDMSVSDLTNGMRVDESEIVDTAQKSAEMRMFRRMAFSSQDYSTNFFMQGDFRSEEP